MRSTQTQDDKLRAKRIEEHVKVLEYLLDRRNLAKHATGERLASTPKLVVFFAGYIAMRRMWDVKTRNGKMKTGDADLDKKKNDADSIIYRIDKEVAHALGYETSTLFVVKKFLYWGKKFLSACKD